LHPFIPALATVTSYRTKEKSSFFQEDKAMTRRSLLALVAGVALAGLTAPVTTLARENANDLDRMMFVKFTRPVALPGVALGAGTYVFELPDPIDAWNVVRVTSQDRRKVYLTAFTRIVDRPRGLRPDQVVSFGEASPSAPQPIKVWWPTGDSTGREFIY
jgi:ABC-type Fe3+ transport system permease subunit